jgi:hypothetical protein
MDPERLAGLVKAIETLAPCRARELKRLHIWRMCYLMLAELSPARVFGRIFSQNGFSASAESQPDVAVCSHSAHCRAARIGSNGEGWCGEVKRRACEIEKLSISHTSASRVLR